MGQSISQEKLITTQNINTLKEDHHTIPDQSHDISSIYQSVFRKYPILETISKNLIADFQGDYTSENLQNIIQFYTKVYQPHTRSQRNTIYNQLKTKFTDQRQISIIEWFQNQRSNKYDSEHLITGKTTKIQKKFIKIQTCRIEVNLIPSKVMSHGNINSVKQNASLETIKIGPTLFQLKDLKTNGVIKQYLFRQNRNSKNPSPTPWIVQKTKDHRYVWRGDIDLDRHNVEYLLKFILKSRDQLDQCPSIVINAGSHGGNSGQNSNDSGMMQYSDLDIYDQIVDIICNLTQKAQELELKLGKFNIKRKIYVHLVSLNIPCIYPQNADHIIDVQCKGAYSKVFAQNLHPKNSPIIEQDLTFLALEQESFHIKYKNSKEKLVAKQGQGEKSLQNKSKGETEPKQTHEPKKQFQDVMKAIDQLKKRSENLIPIRPPPKNFLSRQQGDNIPGQSQQINGKMILKMDNFK